MQPKQMNAGPSNVDVYLRPSPGQCQSYRAVEHAEQPEFCRLAGLQGLFGMSDWNFIHHTHLVLRPSGTQFYIFMS